MADFKLMFEGGQTAFTDIAGCETSEDVRDLLDAQISNLPRAARPSFVTLGGVCFHRQRLIAIEEHEFEEPQ